MISTQFDQACIDYLHERKFPIFGVVMKWGLRATTLGVLAGFYQFNTEDVGEYFWSILILVRILTTETGLTEFIKRIWKA